MYTSNGFMPLHVEPIPTPHPSSSRFSVCGSCALVRGALVQPYPITGSYPIKRNKQFLDMLRSQRPNCSDYLFITCLR